MTPLDATLNIRAAIARPDIIRYSISTQINQKGQQPYPALLISIS